ncbi:unnamed protein product [Paramecium octaurelia]|uniref:Uncharacterized protein n=1 Tax=Paramecium octaurelia TaxID=43137 RepID=A0A8S1TV09_PAROT|nr:unnamed protein product [Paramecium octaurelia]
MESNLQYFKGKTNEQCKERYCSKQFFAKAHQFKKLK